MRRPRQGIGAGTSSTSASTRRYPLKFVVPVLICYHLLLFLGFHFFQQLRHGQLSQLQAINIDATTPATNTRGAENSPLSSSPFTEAITSVSPKSNIDGRNKVTTSQPTIAVTEAATAQIEENQSPKKTVAKGNDVQVSEEEEYQEDEEKCIYGVGIPVGPRVNKTNGNEIEYWQSVIDAIPNEIKQITILSRFPSPKKNAEIEQMLKLKRNQNKGLVTRLIYPAPQKEIQPDFEPYLLGRQLKQLHGDSMERVLWRSSLSLDFVRLVRFLSEQCEYALWIEDDAILLDGWLEAVKAVTPKTSDWMYQFLCEWGSMGVLVNSKHALNLVQYVTHHFDDGPIDWTLLDWAKYYRMKFPSLLQTERHWIVGHKGAVSSFRDAQVRRTIDEHTLVVSKNKRKN